MRKQKHKKPIRHKSTKNKGSASSSSSSSVNNEKVEIIPPEDSVSSQPIKKNMNIFVFFKQVRSELEKITWTSRNETIVSTILVLVMVVIMSVFFAIADQAMRALIKFILSIDI